MARAEQVPSMLPSRLAGVFDCLVGRGAVTTLTGVPDDRGPGTARSMRAAIRSGIVIDELRTALRGLAVKSADILDLGGGTGGLAVQLAGDGHRVTVVDPSPDSLAALDRRAAETGTSDRVRGVQGDATVVGDLVPAGSLDLVLCHSVLEVVDDPAAALQVMVSLVRGHGLISLLVANRAAAVTARVASGRLAEARRLISDPAGRGSSHDAVARRFTLDELQSLIDAAGLSAHGVHGVRVFADITPAALLDDPTSAAMVLELEQIAARDPSYLSMATQLHALCSAQPGKDAS